MSPLRVGKVLAFTSMLLAGPIVSVGCQGEVIDGGASTAVTNGSASSPPVEVPNSFFGRLSLKSLTKTASPEGTEITPSSAGVTFEITFGEDLLYALDNGTTCIRGEYSLQRTSGAAFVFKPAIGREGAHAFEFRDKELVVADLVPGFPWARLVRTVEKSRCP
jgi:hypothetical protein